MLYESYLFVSYTFCQLFSLMSSRYFMDIMTALFINMAEKKKLENFQRYNLFFCVLLGSVNSVFGLFSHDKCVYMG